MTLDSTILSVAQCAASPGSDAWGSWLIIGPLVALWAVLMVVYVFGHRVGV